MEIADNHWVWPDDTLASVSLTYDDGQPDNLDHVVPVLKERGVKATFYLPTGFQHVIDRKTDWKQAFEQGHEIGSHMVQHPARADLYAPNVPDWLPPFMQLENYTREMVFREVNQAADWLTENIGPDPLRTFAYPCSSTAIGREPDEASYDAAVSSRHFAARTGGELTNDPRTVRLLRIHSYGFSNPTLEDLTGYCRNALDSGGWTVLMFHGVGRPPTRNGTDATVHRQILDYLQQQRYWIRPLREVAAYIERCRTSAGYPESLTGEKRFCYTRLKSRHGTVTDA